MPSRHTGKVIIRMGASKFEAVVRADDKLTVFDLNKLGPKGEATFRKELTIAWREATQAYKDQS